MDKSQMKTIVVFIIIVGCFSLLYSRLFHPLISSILGFNQRPKSFDDSEKFPRGFRNSMKDSKKDGSERTKVSGHPGMHALSEMKRFANQKHTSGGGGILGVVLPLYAIGVVIYLIYTLSRLFLRKQNNSSKNNTGVEAHDYADVYVSDSDMKGKVMKKQKELEKLLLKADQEDIGDEEINLLKKRLIETESQMTRILRAMNTIQKTVTSADCYSEIKSAESIQDCCQDEILFDNDECYTQDKVVSDVYNSEDNVFGDVNLKRRVNTSRKDLQL